MEIKKREEKWCEIKESDREEEKERLFEDLNTTPKHGNVKESGDWCWLIVSLSLKTETFLQ